MERAYGTHIRIQNDLKTYADYLNRYYYNPTTTHLYANWMVGLVIFWLVFRGRFTILAFKRY